MKGFFLDLGLTVVVYFLIFLIYPEWAFWIKILVAVVISEALIWGIIRRK